MKSLLLICVLLFSYSVYSQNNKQDTIVPRPSIVPFLQIIDGTFSDTLTTHVWLIGNPDCHRCEEVRTKFKEQNIPYIEYDVRDSDVLSVTYELVRKYEKSEKISFSFPVVVVNTRVYYNMPELGNMIDEIKKALK